MRVEVYVYPPLTPLFVQIAFAFPGWHHWLPVYLPEPGKIPAKRLRWMWWGWRACPLYSHGKYYYHGANGWRPTFTWSVSAPLALLRPGSVCYRLVAKENARK